jgi:hypothetical protein
MSIKTVKVEYGVGNAEHYSEAHPSLDRILTPGEAVAIRKQFAETYPGVKMRIFKRERTDVVTDVTDELT